jgi:hypothetical protein
VGIRNVLARAGGGDHGTDKATFFHGLVGFHVPPWGHA